MNPEQPVAIEDVALAGRGDLAALRRLRDYWLAVASGSETNKLLPKDMVLPQVELLGEMAAAASAQVQDRVPLVAAYQIHAASIEHDVTVCEALARQAAEADNVADLDRWTSSTVDLNERLGVYRSRISALLSDILSNSDATGAAMLVSSLTLQADGGDERAVPLLQYVMDSVTPEQAEAIQAAIRAQETGPSLRFGFVEPPYGNLWADVRRLLDKAVKRDGHSWEDVERELDSLRSQLWLAVRDRPVAAMVTKLDGKTLEVWLAGGDVLSGALPFLETAIAAAKEAGATNGRIWGRKGWERVLRPYGWHRDGELLVKAWD